MPFFQIKGRSMKYFLFICDTKKRKPNQTDQYGSPGGSGFISMMGLANIKFYRII